MDWPRMLREARERAELSRTALAERSRLAARTIKSYESGSRHPSREHLIALLDALRVDRMTRAQILTASGFATDGLPGDVEYPRGMFSAEEAVAEVKRHPWPAFVLDEYMGVIDANRAAQRLWGVDLTKEYLELADRNLLSVASAPRFADRCVNWDQAVTRLLGIYKGKPEAPQQLESPSPYFAAILERFLAGDPKYVARLLEMWNTAPPIWDEKMRWSYPIVWRDPGVGVMTFDCVASIAHHGHGTAFNDWIPVDAETWQRLGELQVRGE